MQGKKDVIVERSNTVSRESEKARARGGEEA